MIRVRSTLFAAGAALCLASAAFAIQPPVQNANQAEAQAEPAQMPAQTPEQIPSEQSNTPEPQQAPAENSSPQAPATTTQATPVAQVAPAYKTVPVRLDTPEGAIVIALEVERAPVTAANFLRYVDQKRFDGVTFYRAMNFPNRPDLGLLQGGAKSDPKRVLPAIKHEPTTQTGLSHVNGAVSMARGAVGTAQGDFFIILGDALTGLDANPKAAGDNAGFAVFGHVTEGMDVVQRLLASPINLNEGVGVMKGQMIAKPVVIRSARRIQK